MRHLLLLALLAATPARAQTPAATPPTFRLVLPPAQGPGAITVSMADGTKLDTIRLFDEGKRPVLQMHNPATGIIVSYIMDHAPGYYDTSEACKNDVLGGVLHGALAKASVKKKVNSSRTLPNGQIMSIGSYFVEKNEGMSVQELVTFGFVAINHTCAYIHLSKSPARPDEGHIFDKALAAFAYDPAYLPTAADYAAMAALLPPGMAAAYAARPSPPPGTTLAPAEPGQSLTFALPNHPGYLHMDAPNFIITERSAKLNGAEFGLRAVDNDISHAEVLGFLFLPHPPQPTATACRDWMLPGEKKDGVKDRKILKTYEDKSDSGVAIALVDYEQPKAPASARFVRRFFVAQGDLCADISVFAANALMAEAVGLLQRTLVFDPARQPDFNAKFRFATVLFDHHAVAAAAPVFESAIPLAGTTAEPLKWRRVTTDQASMSYGMAGDLAHSRALNEAAIREDPDYPMYYYNLACADAEAGNAKAAQAHLAAAYARRANTLQGESMPDAGKDDSILKLKSDPAFWAFVQTLPTSR